MQRTNGLHLTSRQIKAARALLDWSQDDLASASQLSIATIRKLELGHISPRSTTTHHIRQAFENAGLEFIEPNGVRQRPEDIIIYQGLDQARDFFDDVYNTAKKKDCEIIVVSPGEPKYFIDILGDYRLTHVERMTAIKDTSPVRCILTEDTKTLPAVSYCEYRTLSKHYVDSVPFYVYDDKYAIMISEASPSPKIIVLQSRSVAEAFRHQFYSMWEKATPLNKLERSESVTRLKPRISARR
jgi:transcriptional regulator with XRE-family HTH domain